MNRSSQECRDSVDSARCRLQNQQEEFNKADDELHNLEDRAKYFSLSGHLMPSPCNGKPTKPRSSNANGDQKPNAADGYQFQSPIHRHRYLLDAEAYGRTSDDDVVTSGAVTSKMSAADRHRQYLTEACRLQRSERGESNDPARRYPSDRCDGPTSLPVRNEPSTSAANGGPGPKCTCGQGNTVSEVGQLVVDPSVPGYQYESLGRILRSNVIHGPVVTYKSSVTHEDYSPSVFEATKATRGDGSEGGGKTKGLKPTDKYRYRKDDLSTWAEHNIIHNRMMKALDTGKPQKQK